MLNINLLGNRKIVIHRASERQDNYAQSITYRTASESMQRKTSELSLEWGPVFIAQNYISHRHKIAS